MLPYSMTEGGHFTSDSSGVANIQLTRRPDFFMLRDRTDWGVNAASPAEAFWYRGMANDTGKGINQAAGAGFALSGVTIADNGFTFIDTSNPPTYAALATTAITGSAGTFVVTMASTGSIQVGDYVRLYGTTGELQIAGYSFQVTAVTANVSITLGYMASGGQVFAADATAGSVLKYIPNKMYPRWNYIANISQASQAVVSFTAKNDFTPGEIVSFRVPTEFGMDEINNRAVRVLSVTNSSTVSSITIDLDTSGYTAFSFPTSAIAAAGVSPAVAVPSSSGVVPYAGSATVAQQPPGTNLQDAFDNRNQYYMYCGSNVITASKVYDWLAVTYDRFDAQ